MTYSETEDKKLFDDLKQTLLNYEKSLERKGLQNDTRTK